MYRIGKNLNIQNSIFCAATNESMGFKSAGIICREYGSSRNIQSNKETYSEKQAKLGRPVSPHVTIYKFPVAAISSITNRVTGVALTAGMINLMETELIHWHSINR